jgi:hypothetical protein
MEAIRMKVFAIVSTAALLLALGAAVPAFAQEEHHEQEAKPAKQEPKAEQKQEPAKQEQKAQPAKQQAQDKPAKQQEEAKPAKAEPRQQEKQPQQAKTQPQPKQQQEAKSEKQQPAKQVKQDDRGKSAQPQHAQRTPEEEKRQRAEPALRLSVRSNSRIPDDRFRSNFGREHYFRIGSPVMVGGYSRFQYGGFWFGFVQPWPSAWYYTDDVYVDYIDGGYYLMNPEYPSDRISISVVI